MKLDEYPDIDLKTIGEIDALIHSPTRLTILAFLFVVESADFTYLLRRTGLTRGNLSANLRKLEEAGYINIDKEFVSRMPRSMICLTTEGRTAIQEYREIMRQVLDNLLAD